MSKSKDKYESGIKSFSDIGDDNTLESWLKVINRVAEESVKKREKEKEHKIKVMKQHFEKYTFSDKEKFLIEWIDNIPHINDHFEDMKKFILSNNRILIYIFDEWINRKSWYINFNEFVIYEKEYKK